MLTIDDLRAEIVSEAAKAAFDAIVAGLSTEVFRLEPHEQGYLNSLRIWRGEEYCLAAVPNEAWVLAYIRKPELRRREIDTDAVRAAFPEARVNAKGEVTLRLTDAAAAARWVAFVLDAG